jgi:hypothetical protein
VVVVAGDDVDVTTGAVVDTVVVTVVPVDAPVLVFPLEQPVATNPPITISAEVVKTLRTMTRLRPTMASAPVGRNGPQ